MSACQNMIEINFSEKKDLLNRDRRCLEATVREENNIMLK